MFVTFAHASLRLAANLISMITVLSNLQQPFHVMFLPNSAVQFDEKSSLLSYVDADCRVFLQSLVFLSRSRGPVIFLFTCGGARRSTSGTEAWVAWVKMIWRKKKPLGPGSCLNSHSYVFILIICSDARPVMQQNRCHLAISGGCMI